MAKRSERRAVLVRRRLAESACRGEAGESYDLKAAIISGKLPACIDLPPRTGMEIAQPLRFQVHLGTGVGRGERSGSSGRERTDRAQTERAPQKENQEEPVCRLTARHAWTPRRDPSDGLILSWAMHESTRLAALSDRARGQRVAASDTASSIVLIRGKGLLGRLLSFGVIVKSPVFPGRSRSSTR
jgi:hypothetical protein